MTQDAMADPKLRTLLRRGVAEIISESELLERLKEGKPLRLKQGFDPSRPDIHLGHVVGLRKLRQFQELGHEVILIVGDWTAQIGDPSGQSATRSMLSAEEVRDNAQTYLEQFFKVVDRVNTRVVWQSEWFGKFSLADVIRLTSKFTVAQLLAREDFARRYQAGRPIAVTELLYPLLQAYDSLVIRADVEFGGTDQKFNCLVGRELQAMVGQRPQQVFLVPILAGTDGVQKMSKSLGNYIGVTDPPNDMYGKVMSLPDDLVLPYFELLTDVPNEELAELQRQLEAGSVNPMLRKKRLAREVVAQFHGKAQADAAQAHFERVFQRGEIPTEAEVVAAEVDMMADFFHAASVAQFKRQDPVEYERLLSPGKRWADVPHLLVRLGLASSMGEAKRKIQEGGVYIDGQRVPTDPKAGKVWPIGDGTVVRLGRKMVRVKLLRRDPQ